MGVGMREYAKRLMIEDSRLGRRRIGRRMRSPSRRERLIVPNNVVVAWMMAAWTICLEVGAGLERRWKYHWLTVAAVTAR
jgi:hypothetical protein